MISIMEEVTQTGYKLFIMKTAHHSIVIFIPTLNWSTEEIDTYFCNKQKFDHTHHSLIFQIYDGDCTILAQQIIASINSYGEDINQ